MTCSEASCSAGPCRLALAMLVGGALVAAPASAEVRAATTLVAFVQNPETGDVLQTLALPVSSTDCKRAR